MHPLSNADDGAIVEGRSQSSQSLLRHAAAASLLLSGGRSEPGELEAKPEIGRRDSSPRVRSA